MSTICLAAQRSFYTQEAVYFSWRLPSPRQVLVRLSGAAFWLCALIITGLYAHTLWQVRQPAPAAKPAKMVQPEARPSEMHYVYVSKPFPQPKPKVAAPPLQMDSPVADSDADWQQAPDGDLSTQPLPHVDTEADNSDASLKERFMMALKAQQQDYARGKVPSPPDETDDEVKSETQ